MTFILLDNARDEDGTSYLFEDPFDVVRADAPEKVGCALEKIQTALDNGAYAAGFFSYELGYVLERKLAPLLPSERDTPLIWFGLFKTRKSLKRGCVRAWLENITKTSCDIENIHPHWNEKEYAAAFMRIQNYIAAGDIYQANLTFKAAMQVKGDISALYMRLRASQPVSYGAYIHTPSFKILSSSPELFVRKTGMQLETIPMKGTAARAALPADDAQIAHGLTQDEKSKAENLMIVDLMRNDMGRLAEIGSVKVPELFHVETYRTLHQMTSTVTAHMKRDVTLHEFLSALFPAGSVTGAPKIRAQEIIRECESAPRGVYTGAIGMFAPDGDAVFNVAIRTLMVREDGCAEMGIGSGVVYDSVAVDEYRECLLKMKFLTNKVLPFQLIETLLWTAENGFAYAALHKERMASSASYFGFRFDDAAYEEKMAQWACQQTREYKRVRVLLAADGTFSITASPLAKKPDTWRYSISDRRVNSADTWLYHKTTQRGFLDEEMQKAKEASGADEVIFLNERGELTQGSYTNIFLDMPNGRMLTPQLSAGLLPGVLRAAMLAEGKVVEAVLTPADLTRAKTIYFGNSVRGLIKATPIEQQKPVAAE